MKFKAPEYSGLAVAILLVLVNLHCKPVAIENSVNYPMPRPDSMPLKFMNGLVSSDTLDFNASFSLDGKSFYFARSQHGKYRILVCNWDGIKWKDPIPAKFADTLYSNADPFVHSNGFIYFISNKPKNETDTIPDYDIWVVHPLEGDHWSGYENVEAVNSDSTEYYVSLAANGNLYFASDRSGGLGDHDIYKSEWKDGKYMEPQNLGPAINTGNVEHDPCISKDETVLIYTAAGRPDSFGEADLYYSTRSTGQSWANATNMGKVINTSTYEYCPFLTTDGKYFFYSSEFDVKWISTQHLPFLLKAEN